MDTPCSGEIPRIAPRPRQLHPAERSPSVQEPVRNPAAAVGLDILLAEQGKLQAVADMLPAEVADMLPAAVVDTLPAEVADMLPAEVADMLPAEVADKLQELPGHMVEVFPGNLAVPY